MQNSLVATCPTSNLKFYATSKNEEVIYVIILIESLYL